MRNANCAEFAIVEVAVTRGVWDSAGATTPARVGITATARGAVWIAVVSAIPVVAAVCVWILSQGWRYWDGFSQYNKNEW